MTIAEFLVELRKPCKVFVQTKYTADDTICVQAVKADVIWNLQQGRHNLEVLAQKMDNGDWVIN
jgi:hypothetical protein